MPPRVLVVDDEQSVTVTMAAILEMDGYSVATALRGVEALELIRQEVFDLVLTDLRLDDFDGMDVLAAARRKSPDTVGIVLTGYASLESAVKALREGAYDYMLKPADVEELRATVARGIERRKLGQQLRERVADLEAANRTINELNEGLQDRIAKATADLQARVRELDAARAELQAGYEKLQELDKLKSQFLSIASHELKTPITAMSGFVQIAVRRIRRRLGAGRPDEPDWKKEEETLLEQLEVVQRQTGKLARLVDELLDVSRIESGRLELKADEVDLPELLAEVMRRHQLMATKHELRLHYDPEGKLGARGDRDHLEQVMNNLIGNAMKYSPEGGPIDVSVRDLEGRLRIEVRDRGLGIASEHHSRIFTKFYRAEARASGIAGAGLGLAVARDIVEAHGGHIGFTSSEGAGSTFWVSLPSVGEPAAGRTRAAS